MQRGFMIIIRNYSCQILTMNYIKRCLNSSCLHAAECEHGLAQKRFKEYFPQGMKELPYFMLKNFKAIYPVAYGCPRWKMEKQILDQHVAEN